MVVLTHGSMVRKCLKVVSFIDDCVFPLPDADLMVAVDSRFSFSPAPRPAAAWMGPTGGASLNVYAAAAAVSKLDPTLIRIWSIKNVLYTRRESAWTARLEQRKYANLPT